MKFLRFLLFPFAIVYDIITRIRNWMFDIDLLKSTSFDVPVIAVGNLSVGGTGKTPMIEYLIRLLKEDYKIAVLSRGYKRKTKGYIQLSDKHSAEDVGDEPLQFYKKFNNEVSVSVDANRTNGIQHLLKSEDPPNVILLDDAYQHRKVKASTYILLTKYNDLYVDDYLLPTGNLRECRTGANRADLVVVTKCPSKMSFQEQVQLKNKLKLTKHQPVFFSTIVYQPILYGVDSQLALTELIHSQVLLVTGIANPKPLEEYLTDKQVSFTHLKFKDHHHFSTADIQKIISLAKGKVVLTTEKDFVRLQSYELENLYYIAIATKFLPFQLDFSEYVCNTLKR